MKLTDTELEIMSILWENNVPMSSAEIIEASNARTWKESSIYAIINTLIGKGAVIQSNLKPTSTKNVRAYKPVISQEEYIVLAVSSIKKSLKSSLRFDNNAIVEGIRALLEVGHK